MTRKKRSKNFIEIEHKGGGRGRESLLHTPELLGGHRLKNNIDSWPMISWKNSPKPSRLSKFRELTSALFRGIFLLPLFWRHDVFLAVACHSLDTSNIFCQPLIINNCNSLHWEIWMVQGCVRGRGSHSSTERCSDGWRRRGKDPHFTHDSMESTNILPLASPKIWPRPKQL